MTANEALPTIVDAVVDGDGNLVVPASQLPEPLAPGVHVRLRVVSDARGPRRSLYGALPDLPDLTWEDFERASRLAVADAERGNRGG